MGAFPVRASFLIVGTTKGLVLIGSRIRLKVSTTSAY